MHAYCILYSSRLQFTGQYLLSIALLVQRLLKLVSSVQSDILPIFGHLFGVIITLLSHVSLAVRSHLMLQEFSLAFLISPEMFCIPRDQTKPILKCALF